MRVQQVQRGEKKARVEGEERRTEMEACTHRIARTWCSRSLPPPQRAHALPTRGGTAGRERHGRWRWEGVCSVCVVCLPPSCSLRVCECVHTWSAMLSGGGVPLSTLSRALPGVHLALCTPLQCAHAATLASECESGSSSEESVDEEVRWLDILWASSGGGAEGGELHPASGRPSFTAPGGAPRAREHHAHPPPPPPPLLRMAGCRWRATPHTAPGCAACACGRTAGQAVHHSAVRRLRACTTGTLAAGCGREAE